MSDLFVSWEEYHQKTEELAIKVHDDGWEFNQVVCIAKGGMRVGDVFARIFNVPLAILSVESYKGEGVKNLVVFYQDLCGLCKKNKVIKESQKGRGTYFCPKCQV